MAFYRFVGLSTGRAGSRYLAQLLNAAGVPAVHEVGISSPNFIPPGTLGEVSAHLVTASIDPGVKVFHFTRHPQPFVSSLMRFGFWNMYAQAIHPYLRRTGDLIGDSYRYWVDWNRRILDIDEPQRMTFRIEDISRELVGGIASRLGVEADLSKIDPRWHEKQLYARIPADVEGEVEDLMEILGYAPRR